MAGSGDLAVVADEELGGRRGVVVEQVLGRLGHQRLVAEHHEARVLAGEVELLRAGRGGRRRGGRRVLLGLLGEGGGDQTARHVGVMHDRAAHRRAHGGQAGAAEEAAARNVRAPAEHDGVGALGVFGVKLVDQSLSLGHRASPGAAACAALLFRHYGRCSRRCSMLQAAHGGRAATAVDSEAARLPSIGGERCVTQRGSAMDLELKGKVAIVTGGSRGIGKAIGRVLAQEGANVALIARNPAALEAAAAEISKQRRRTGQGLRVRHHRRRGGEEDGGRRGGRLRPRRHPGQLRGQAERTGAAADAGRDHHRGVLGPHQHQGGGLPAHRARGGAAHDQAEVGPHHQRQRARRAPAPAPPSAASATSAWPR